MKNRGFTLLEMVITIVITSFIMLGIAGYLHIGIQAYGDTVARQRMETQAQWLLEKMSREIRHAVPNSFDDSLSNDPNRDPNEIGCLSFTPIKYSGFYTDWGSDIRYILGDSTTALPSGLRIVIYPTQASDLIAGSSSSMNIPDNELNKGAGFFTLSGATSNITTSSVSNRHFIYDPNVKVKYCFNIAEGTNKAFLTRNDVRISDSILQVDASVSAAHSQSYLSYKDASLNHSGLVQIHLALEQHDERSDYQQDVQVLNVP